MMIPHHQSAVYMAEGFIESGKDPQLNAIAKKMIADQNIYSINCNKKLDYVTSTN